MLLSTIRMRIVNFDPTRSIRSGESREDSTLTHVWIVGSLESSDRVADASTNYLFFPREVEFPGNLDDTSHEVSRSQSLFSLRDSCRLDSKNDFLQAVRISS